MMLRRLHSLIVGVALLAATASVPAAEPDVPSRIGRLNLVSGEVTFRLVSDANWSTADVNYPVYTGMTLSTDSLARAEISIGPNALHMAGDTRLEMTTLSERLTDIVLHQGHIYLSVHQMRPGESVELELSHGSVWLLLEGHYEIDKGASNASGYVRVLDGKARFVGNNADLGIATGERALLMEPDKITVGPETPPATPPPPDDFSKWAKDRDALPISDVPKNLARDTSGYEMLDAYGNWQSSGAYGQVWIPSEVPADWQPYRYGHWVSIAPWGPTWVDDQPWGFVPFHYGRWAMVDGQWAWAPGDPNEPEVYAPALVAFLGSADQALMVDRSGEAAVGWVPLAPNEPYYPWYPADAAYVERVNRADVREFRHLSRERIEEARHAGGAREFANRHFTTVVNHATFVGAGPVTRGMLQVPAERLARAPVMAGAPRFDAGQGRRLAAEQVVAPGPQPGSASVQMRGPQPGSASAPMRGPQPGSASAPMRGPQPGSASAQMRGPQPGQAPAQMRNPQARPAFQVPAAARPAPMVRAAPAARAAPASGGKKQK